MHPVSTPASKQTSTSIHCVTPAFRVRSLAHFRAQSASLFTFTTHRSCGLAFHYVEEAIISQYLPLVDLRQGAHESSFWVSILMVKHMLFADSAL